MYGGFNPVRIDGRIGIGPVAWPSWSSTSPWPLTRRPILEHGITHICLTIRNMILSWNNMENHISTSLLPIAEVASDQMIKWFCVGLGPKRCCTLHWSSKIVYGLAGILIEFRIDSMQPGPCVLWIVLPMWRQLTPQLCWALSYDKLCQCCFPLWLTLISKLIDHYQGGSNSFFIIRKHCWTWLTALTSNSIAMILTHAVNQHHSRSGLFKQWFSLTAGHASQPLSLTIISRSPKIGKHQEPLAISLKHRYITIIHRYQPQLYRPISLNI